MQNPSFLIGICLPVLLHHSHTTSPSHGYKYYACNELFFLLSKMPLFYSRVVLLMTTICLGDPLHHKCLYVTYMQFMCLHNELFTLCLLCRLI